MAINPYTLNNLYQNGILDYVPTDLLMASPMGTMTPMSNPYLDMAKQGGLYQHHGMATDSFHSSYFPFQRAEQFGVSHSASFTPAYTPNDYQSVSTGSNYGAAVGNYNQRTSYNYNGYGNAGNYGAVKIGSISNAGGMNAFNGYGIGAYNNNNIASAFGEDGIVGVGSNAGGVNAFGGFTDATNSISSGINKTTNLINRTPKFILGILAGIIGIAGIKMAFKRGKVPSTSSGSFWSKLNPLNWFRKK